MKASRVVTAVALVGLLSATVFLAQPTQTEQPDRPAVVARLPWEGDMARYEFVGDATDICSDGSAVVELHDRLQLRWSSEDRIIWDGSEQRFQALESMWESRHCSELDGAWWAMQETHLYQELPGHRVAHANQLVGLSRMPMPSYYLDDVLEQVEYDKEACLGPPMGLVSGLDPDEALNALATCSGHGVFPAGVPVAKWLDDEQFGATWLVQIESTDADHLGIRYSPAASMPVEMSWSSSQHGNGHLRMTGWQDGGIELPTRMPPLPRPLQLRDVPWGQIGPEEDDLGLFPIADARDAVAQTRAGQSFFNRHPQAGIARVSFWADWQSPDQPTDGDSDVERAVGVMIPQAECSRIHGTAVDGMSRPPAIAQNRFLEISWADTALALHADVRSSGAPYELGLDGTAAVDEDPTLTNAETPGLSVGPTWAELLEAHDLVVALGGEGRLRIDVGQGALGIERLGPPGGIADLSEPTTLASVRLYECGIRGDVNTGFHEHGVRFALGRLQSQWSYQAEYTQTALRNAGLSDPPPWDAPTLASVSSEPTWPRQAAIAAGAVAGSVLIVRFFVALFTRFAADDLAQNPTRRAVLDTLSRCPGIPLPEIMREQGLTRAQARHHVRMLEQSGQIETIRTWRGLVLFPAGHAGTRTADVMNLAHAPALLGLIERRPGIHVTGASERLGLPKARVSQLANSLESAGLVHRVRAGRRVALHRA